jgi:hypothetical protein
VDSQVVPTRAPHHTVEGSFVRTPKKRALAVLGLGLAFLVFVAAPAFAATTITTPSSNPFTIPEDAQGNPVSFTISGGGFPANAPNVVVEQCDGTNPATTPGWSPNTHCDLATSPSPTSADANGNYTFPANDPNFGFTPFPPGPSPSNLFNCLYPGQTPPANGKPSFTNCQIRVSSNDTAVTSDQVFLTLTYPQPTSSVSEVPVAIVLPLGFLAIGGAFWLIRRRRAGQAAAAV